MKGSYLRWKISYDPHAAGTDRGNPRDAGEAYACQIALFHVLKENRGGYLRWSISWQPHAAGTDRGNPRDAGEAYACQITSLGEYLK